MVGAAIALLAAAAWAKPVVIITIDVESQALGLPAQVDAACSDGSRCGLMAISRSLARRGLAGTFFLSVFEHRTWGEPALRDIVGRLQADGHDVELHTHPQFAYDPTRNEMFQYRLDEQTAIIRDGAALLSRWTGRPVVAHRAGDYAADPNTLLALQRNGIPIDSSLLAGHAHCRLTVPPLKRNLPARSGDVIEVPVTVFLQAESPAWLTNHLAPVTTLRKIDVNWLADERQSRAAIDAAVSADLPVIVIFLHSFSLLRADPGGGPPVADAVARANLDALLDEIQAQQLQVVSARDIAAHGATLIRSDAPDLTPTLRRETGMLRYLWHRLHGPGQPPDAGSAGVAR